MPNCELCGTPVEVVSGDDGTAHYKPLDAHRERLERAAKAVSDAWWEFEGNPPESLTPYIEALDAALAEPTMRALNERESLPDESES